MKKNDDYVIDPREVQKFLNKECDNWGWIKDLSDADLDEELDRLGFCEAYTKKPLWTHTKACVLLGLAQPFFSFWLDMGTGKTRLMLELMRHLMLYEGLRQVLVLCPSEQAVNTWEEQIIEWKINLPYVALGNSPTEDKWDSLTEMGDHGFIFATNMGFVWMLSKKKPKKRKGKIVKRNGKVVMTLTRMDSLVEKFRKHVDAVIIDESTKYGNQDSKFFQCARAVSKFAKRRYNLAGRPFGRDPTMVWSQQWLVDRGETLGDTLGLFRQAFFREKKNHWGGYDYTFNDRMEDTLAEMMAHRSITYAESECKQLPPLVEIIENIKLPQEAEAYYKKAVDALIAAKGNYIETNNSFVRMRQISSGFLGYKDDETGERAQFEFSENPKLDRLLELIDEMPCDRYFVIFHYFTYSGRRIQEELKKQLGIKVNWLHGGIKDSKEIQTDFRTNPKRRGIIVNTNLGAMNLNLQKANYAFCFEAPLDPIDWAQLKKRIHRGEQDKTCFLYDMRCKGTMDAQIRAHHEEGDNLFKAVLRDPYKIAV